MKLTTEQLAELTERVRTRIDEFGVEGAHLAAPSLGIVRLVMGEAEPLFLGEREAQMEKLFDARLTEFRRGWEAAQELFLHGEDEDAEDYDDRGGHRRFPATTPEGHPIMINGDPNMDDETRHALGELADAARKHLCAKQEAERDERADAVRAEIANGHTAAIPVTDDNVGDAPPSMVSRMPVINTGMIHEPEPPAPAVPRREPLNHTPPTDDPDADLTDSIPTPLDGLRVTPPATAPASTAPDPAIFDLIRGLAVDGIMPRQAEYDDAKAEDWPTSTRLKQIIGKTWSELATELGLKMLKPAERARAVLEARAAAQKVTALSPQPPPPTPSPTASATHGVDVAKLAQPRTLDEADAEAELDALRLGADKKAEMLRDIITELRIMSVDGQTMPTMEEWDSKRAAGLPKAQAVMRRHALDWNRLANYARLTPSKKGARYA